VQNVPPVSETPLPSRMMPVLAALTYPVLIWAGPAISPVFLVISLIVPDIAVNCLHQASLAYPRARNATLLAVAAPPLYSWLGGLFDFQRTLPLNSLGVWYLLWIGLAIMVAAEQPRAPRPLPARPSRLAFAHGCSAAIITLFGVAHLTNHLAGLGGGALHTTVMAALRPIYRAAPFEAVLLAAIAFQIVSGLRLLRPHAERGHSWWATAQTSSGVYMALFFCSHLTAALRARWLRGIDTNWHWLTADSMLSDPWSARLAPYYFLAVIAFGVHAGLGLRYVLRGRGWSPAAADRAGLLPTAVAAIAAIAIMTALLSA
jgi:succinate dehydrogenase/fumarate reductase cytochrome b subunit